jgi:hypothetical protein
LPWCFPTTELLGQQHSPQRVPARQAANGFGRVSLPLVEKLIPRRLTERMIDTGIEVGYGLENMSAGQSCGDRLRHEAASRR